MPGRLSHLLSRLLSLLRLLCPLRSLCISSSLCILCLFVVAVVTTTSSALAQTADKGDDELKAIGQCKELLNAKQYAKAIAILCQAIDKSPLSSQLHLWRGNAYWKICDYRDAIKDFDTAINQDDSSADACAHKAVFLARLGLYDDALVMFRAAAKRKTADPTITLLV